MRARAPGKVVLSGAYAVLDGARAIVAAVDRYVLADSERAAEFVTPEVRAALTTEPPPWFDASALRDNQKKLGLGSSAAILTASLGALELTVEPELELATLRERVLRRALAAHRAAQGGGSGVDVAASVYGGIQVVTPAHAGLALEPVTLPAGLCVEVLASGTPASTPALIRSVRELAARDRARYERLMSRQAEASERAADAILRGDGAAWLAALRQQGEALAALGAAAGVEIVTPQVARLAAKAARAGAAALPAGAGGGDIAIIVRARDSAPLSEQGLHALELTLGAEGLRGVDAEDPRA